VKISRERTFLRVAETGATSKLTPEGKSSSIAAKLDEILSYIGKTRESSTSRTSSPWRKSFFPKPADGQPELRDDTLVPLRHRRRRPRAQAPDAAQALLPRPQSDRSGETRYWKTKR